jgi:multiple sugar transport system substrate-binding protein
MSNVKGKRVSRRDFIRLAATAAAAGPFFTFPSSALAGKKTLKIAKWAHFLPEYDAWFLGMAKAWGKQYDTAVTVDSIPVEAVWARAMAEAKAGKGHDVFMFPWPPAEFQQHVIDHGEVYQTVAGKYGQIDRFSHRSTFNRKDKRYFAFADSWIPTPVHYFQDYWGEIGGPLGPVHYGGLHAGAQRIKAKFGIPCGLAVTPTLEGNITLHTLLFAFGGMVFDQLGKIVINVGARTGAALQYAKALYQDAGSPEQLTWGSADNVRAMVARKTSCSLNGISLLRTAEKENSEVAKKIRIQPPLLGHTGTGVFGLPHVTNCSAVWNFAQNQAGAKQFLADLIDNSKTAYEKSQGCNFPTYQKTLPDLIVRLEKDPQGDPPYKYHELRDALHWTHNLGFPNYADPVSMEVFNTFVIPRMFMSVIKGELTAADAARAAETEVNRIADKWKQAGQAPG